MFARANICPTRKAAHSLELEKNISRKDAIEENERKQSCSYAHL